MKVHEPKFLAGKNGFNVNLIFSRDDEKDCLCIMNREMNQNPIAFSWPTFFGKRNRNQYQLKFDFDFTHNNTKCQDLSSELIFPVISHDFFANFNENCSNFYYNKVNLRLPGSKIGIGRTLPGTRRWKGPLPTRRMRGTGRDACAGGDDGSDAGLRAGHCCLLRCSRVCAFRSLQVQSAAWRLRPAVRSILRF